MEPGGDNSGVTPRGRGRPPKYSTEEARSRLLNAGVALLLEGGLVPGLRRVSLDSAIGASGVPRGTAYQLWPSSDAFQKAVLVAMFDSDEVRAHEESSDEAILSFVSAKLAELPAEGERSQEVVLAMVRDLVPLLVEFNFNSDEFRLTRSITVAVASMPDIPEEVVAAMRAAEARSIQRHSVILKKATELAGAELREGYSHEDVIRLTGALFEGFAARADAASLINESKTGQALGPEQTLIAIGIEAIIRQMFRGVLPDLG